MQIIFRWVKSVKKLNCVLYNRTFTEISNFCFCRNTILGEFRFESYARNQKYSLYELWKSPFFLPRIFIAQSVPVKLEIFYFYFLTGETRRYYFWWNFLRKNVCTKVLENSYDSPSNVQTTWKYHTRPGRSSRINTGQSKERSGRGEPVFVYSWSRWTNRMSLLCFLKLEF